MGFASSSALFPATQKQGEGQQKMDLQKDPLKKEINEPKFDFARFDPIKIEPRVIKNITQQTQSTLDSLIHNDQSNLLNHQNIAEQTAEIEVIHRETSIFQQDSEIDEVFITDPKTADVQIIDSRSLYIFGVNPGSTSILCLSKDKRTLKKLTVYVKASNGQPGQLQAIIKKIVPTAKVEVVQLPTGILLKGSIESTKDGELIQDIAEKTIEGRLQILNYMTISRSMQINLRVKIAEVSRSVSTSLGVNWQANATQGNFAFGIIPEAGSSQTGPFLNFQKGALKLNAIFQTLENEGLATILAEPNLIALSGKSASFSVGGEIPYQTAAGSLGTSSVEFKKYGINLAFTPTVVGDTIHLKLSTEVSGPDGTTSGGATALPGLSTKNAETSVALGNGQSLMIAGLLYKETDGNENGYAGLGDIPIFGRLFRTNSLKDSRRELVIIVTPYLVEPISASEKFSDPTSAIKFVNMVERLLSKHVAYYTDDHPDEKLGENPGQQSNKFDSAGFYF
ncbi:MAG: type II and III secretion system protein family protein [Alphaproteobacteria bacterium]|nr:type II and III secretion system protein family protein [Alphaproteobacteria bacterium]